MKQAIKDLITHLIEVIARLAAPALERQLGRLASLFISDVPHLDGAWVVRFRDPLRSGKSRIVVLDTRLTQFGRRIHGSAHLQGRPADLFEFFAQCAIDDCHVLSPVRRACCTPAIYKITRLSRWMTSSKSLRPSLDAISAVFNPLISNTSPEE